jgi:hypothetical protein
MNKLLLLSIFFLHVAGYCSAQPVFQKIFGATSNTAWHVEQTTDGGYVLSGGSLFFIKTNAQGDILWTKKSDGGPEDIYCVKQTEDGGFIASGTAYNVGAGNADAFLMKADGAGNPVWSKTYGGIYNDDAFTVQQTFDGGYILLGSSASFGTGNTDFDVYMIKTNSNGDTLWTRLFGDTLRDDGLGIQQTADSGYIITGGSESFGAGQNDVYLIKTDVNGNLEWSKTYGGTEADIAWSVRQTADGGYITCGTTHSCVENNYGDLFLLRTDANGDTLWTRAFGGLSGTEQGYSVQQTSDGGFIAIGETYSLGAGHSDCYLVKTDSIGNLQWSKAFGGTEFEHAYSVKQAYDGGYIIAATSNDLGTGGFYFIKTDSAGNSGCNEINAATMMMTPVLFASNSATSVNSNSIIIIQNTLVDSGINPTILCTTVGIPEGIANGSFTIYPNPAHNSFSISINGVWQDAHNAELQIFDLAGRMVHYQTIINPDIIGTGIQSSVIDCNFSPGIYFVAVTVADKKFIQKLVVE